MSFNKAYPNGYIFLIFIQPNIERDDDNIPDIDLPKESTEPLPESSRPRKDGPGGE